MKGLKYYPSIFFIGATAIFFAAILQAIANNFDAKIIRASLLVIAILLALYSIARIIVLTVKYIRMPGEHFDDTLVIIGVISIVALAYYFRQAISEIMTEIINNWQVLIDLNYFLLISFLIFVLFLILWTRKKFEIREIQ
jgi:predicted acyltransferase